MKKIFILTIFIFLILITFVNAECQQNNEFIIGENITVCTGRCIYYNSTLRNYQDCDDTIKCKLTTYYPNGTSLITNVDMIRNNTIYEYNFGFLTDIGYYNSVVSCDGIKGWQDVSFDFIISNTDGTTYGGGGATVASRIKYLDDIEFVYSDLYFDFNNIIYINTLDKNDNYYGVYNLDVEMLTNVEHIKKITKLNNGRYKMILNIPKSNIADVYMNFEATDEGSKIEKLESFTIREATFLERVKLTTLNFSSIVEDNLLKFVIGLLILLLIFIFVIIIFLKKEK